MKRKQKSLKRRVLFNASVILAGINSPCGGSAKVLGFAKEGKIEGVISEVIFDEAMRHAEKVKVDRYDIVCKCKDIFERIVLAPSLELVKEYSKRVIDEGDAHVLATASEQKVDYLVTLDRKHLLILKDEIKEFKIVTPGELIGLLVLAKTV